MGICWINSRATADKGLVVHFGGGGIGRGSKTSHRKKPSCYETLHKVSDLKTLNDKVVDYLMMMYQPQNAFQEFTPPNFSTIRWVPGHHVMQFLRLRTKKMAFIYKGVSKSFRTES